MGWVRIDDSFPDHAKVLRVGGAGVALFLEGLCYTNRHLTDGDLPRHVVAAMRLVPKPLRVAETLVDANLWEVTEGGWRIHDYHVYNPTAAEVRQKREADAARKRKTTPSGGAPDSVGNPLGIHAESSPRADARVGVGWDVLRNGASGEEPEKGAGADWSEGAAWDCWRAIAGAHHAKCPVIAGPGNYQHLRTLAGTYTRAEVEGALRAWWDSPHTGGRNLGLFVSQMPELLEHLQRNDGTVFRAPRRVAREPRRDLTVVRDEWVCPHDPHCGGQWACQRKSELDAARQEVQS